MTTHGKKHYSISISMEDLCNIARTHTHMHIQTHLICGNVGHCQLGLIIQHLLKVGHVPRRVCRVPVKTLRQTEWRKADRSQGLMQPLYNYHCKFGKDCKLPEPRGHEFPLKPSFVGCGESSAVPLLPLRRPDLQTSMTSGTSDSLECRNSSTVHFSIEMKNATAR